MSYAECGCAICLHYCLGLTARLGYETLHVTERFLPGKLSQNVINKVVMRGVLPVKD